MGWRWARAFSQMITSSPGYRDTGPDAVRDGGRHRRHQHGGGCPRRRASIDMIESVGPLCGKSRRSNVSLKGWLNVSNWPTVARRSQN